MARKNFNKSSSHRSSLQGMRRCEAHFTPLKYYVDANIVTKLISLLLIKIYLNGKTLSAWRKLPNISKCVYIAEGFGRIKIKKSKWQKKGNKNRTIFFMARRRNSSSFYRSSKLGSSLCTSGNCLVFCCHLKRNFGVRINKESNEMFEFFLSRCWCVA